MPALVKLSHLIGYLGIDSKSRELVGDTYDGFGIRLPVGLVQAIGGKSDGSSLDDKVVDANQQVLITLPITLKPRKYQILLSVNPELLSYGMVSAPSIIEPTRPESIVVAFKAARKTDLKQFEHIFELYMLD